MKDRKSLIHLIVALVMLMNGMNFSTFGAVITYAQEAVLTNQSQQTIKEFDELLDEDSQTLVKPAIDDELSQKIREVERELNRDSQQIAESVEAFEEESTLELVEVPEEESTLESVEAPEEESMFESVEAPQEESTLELVEVPQEESTLELVEAPQGESTFESNEYNQEQSISELQGEFEAVQVQESISRNYAHPVLLEQGNTVVNYANLADAWNALLSQNSTSVATIKFVKDYTITTQDAAVLTKSFKQEGIIFTANPGVTITISTDLSFYEGYYVSWGTTANSKFITFENINLKFTAQHSLITNSLWLHMGKNVEMVGSHYPKIIMGSINNNPHPGDQYTQSTYNSRVYIESGTYSELIANSEINGRLSYESSSYIYGGTIKKFLYGTNATSYREHGLTIYGGSIESIEDVRLGDDNRISGLKVYIRSTQKMVFDNVRNLRLFEVGQNHPVIESTVEISGTLSFNTSKYYSTALNVSSGSTFILGENSTPVTVTGGTFSSNTNILLPANRDKANIPLTMSGNFYFPLGSEGNVQFGASNKIVKDEFYFIKMMKNNVNLDSVIIAEDENFYIESGEEEGYDIYLIASKKLGGPLIYDFDQNKMFYVDKNGAEQDAWWFNDKISSKSASLDNLSYENLSKHAHYEIISPNLMTIQFRGNGSNKVFKFTNEKQDRRLINIEFNSLSLTNAELKFENVNSIILDGENNIYQDVSHAPAALTYSLLQASNTVKWNTNASFSVYSQDSGEYQIRNQVVMTTNGGNASVVKVSLEKSPDTDKKLQLYPIDNLGAAKKLMAKANYQKMSVLLPSDGNNYILCDGLKASCQPEEAYYYQSSASNNTHNSGAIGTRFTLNTNATSDYYKASNEARVYVKVTQNSNHYYYLDATLEEAMTQHVAHIGGTHEVTFLGNYEINTDADIQAVENHNKNTNGVTFKTQIDDIKYILKISKDLTLKQELYGAGYPVTFNQIKWQSTVDDVKIYVNGRHLTFGNDVEMVGNFYPSIMGWHRSNQIKLQPRLNIESGTYKSVVGHHVTTAGSQLTLNISGGTFNGDVVGANVASPGTVDIRITGGVFNGQLIGAMNRASGVVTMNVSGGTFNGNVIGGDNTTGAVNLIMSNGTFNNEVIGITNQASGNARIEISGGTFASLVSGATNQTSGAVEVRILGGTFNRQVYGANTTSSPVTMIISNGVFSQQVDGSYNTDQLVNMTISGGTFTQAVHGSTSQTNSPITMTITGGRFAQPVYGAEYARGTVTLTITNGDFRSSVKGSDGANQVIFDISGGTFIGYVAPTFKNASVTLTISGGVFHGLVNGNGSSNGASPRIDVTIKGGTFKSIVYGAMKNTPVVNMMITGGAFESEVIGQSANAANNNVKIKIDGQVSIPTIKGYDLLSIGETTSQSVLTITNALLSLSNCDEKVQLQNESTLKLAGNKASQIKTLSWHGTNNKLSLSGNQSMMPLTITNGYEPDTNHKLIFEVVGTKGNGFNLIDCPAFTADITNFQFSDADYYIRDKGKNNGRAIYLYEKMDPTKISFEWNLETNALTYVLDNGTKQEVWWNAISLSASNVTVDEANLMQYKGTEIFKNPSRLTEIKFELVGTTSDKTIAINSGTKTPWTLQLNAVTLTNSTLQATNLNQIEITGQSVMTSLTNRDAVFSYSFYNSNQANKIVATNAQSNLVVYSKATGGILPTNSQGGDIGQVLALTFDKIDNVEQTIRLVEKNQETTYQIPANTEKMSLLFASSPTSRTFELCHGTNSCTGSSQYVAGNTSDTFTDHFTTQNDQVTNYQYVRRATPYQNIKIDIPSEMSFNINLGSASFNDVSPNNWQNYFTAQPINIENNSRIVQDVYTDSNGITHYFGEKSVKLGVGYNGIVEDGNASIELVAPSALDSNLTMINPGAKVALKLSDRNQQTADIPLDSTQLLPSNPLGWDVEPNKSLILDIEPNFDPTNSYFFNADNISRYLRGSYHLKFKFNLVVS